MRTLHPRYKVVTAAKLKLSTCLHQILGDTDLTHVELWSVLAEICAEWSRIAVKDERE